jgi:uncharacterized protein YvpB
MKVQLEVPFYSQKDNVYKEEYVNNSCGIVCVKMVLAFAGKDSGNIDELVQEGYIVGGTESVGWNHETLVRVLRNHGVLSYRQEFKAHNVEVESKKGTENSQQTKYFRQLGIEKIKGSIDYGFPVIVSMKPGFGENGGDHLILIVGYDEENFYVNDPQRKGQEKDPIRVSAEKFEEYWKGLTIFVEF